MYRLKNTKQAWKLTMRLSRKQRHDHNSVGAALVLDTRRITLRKL
jgi:hypothetical protein